MKEIDPEQIAEKYNNIDCIWDTRDLWHQWTKNRIEGFVHKYLNHIGKTDELRILNAGSGGNSYGINEGRILHLDIAKNKISHLSNAIIGDIQAIPGDLGAFDLLLCVGSVINYCDPLEVFLQFEKVAEVNGWLILEFESSCTLELFGKAQFNKPATIVDTFYNGKVEKLWLFSNSYIKQLAYQSGFELVLADKIHILSPLIYRLTRDEIKSARYAKYDNTCAKLPWLNKFSSNIIMLFRKVEKC